MPKKIKTKQLCVDDLRHAEYYGMQEVFDTLYADSKNGKIFTELTEFILSRENILLAYRNIKTNSGSKTAGTDKLTIDTIGRMSAEEVVDKVRYITVGTKHGYRPKPVRRKEIPKPNGKTRPLGIPCIWDRLVQQCIKQILDPICEAKFSHNSYGFRPNRNAKNAMRRVYNLMQLSHLHYVVEFDIKGFFDNVDHSKLIRQIWSLGIRDKHLIYLIKQILKATIKMPDGKMIYPNKGTPQGGIISPLLANIVLNELDRWIESQWQSNPLTRKLAPNKCNGKEYLRYRLLKGTKLKEMFIVRYADDFRIFCKNKDEAERIKTATTQWLKERLRLDVSPEKTRVVNARQRYSEFLGFKVKLFPKGNRYLIRSHICDKQIQRQSEKLKDQIKNMANPRSGHSQTDEARLYNSMVMGLHEYYCTASCVSADFNTIRNKIEPTLVNRMQKSMDYQLADKGRELTIYEKDKYGKSKLLKYLKGCGEPLYPISYVKYENPVGIQIGFSCYILHDREKIHANLKLNTNLLRQIMLQKLNNESVEYADNRLSLFCAQWGKCAITGKEFNSVSEIHCHHKIPRSMGGGDEYANLVLVDRNVHRLIHATNINTVKEYVTLLGLNHSQIEKLNALREKAGLNKIF